MAESSGRRAMIFFCIFIILTSCGMTGIMLVSTNCEAVEGIITDKGTNDILFVLIVADIWVYTTPTAYASYSIGDDFSESVCRNNNIIDAPESFRLNFESN